MPLNAAVASTVTPLSGDPKPLLLLRSSSPMPNESGCSSKLRSFALRRIPLRDITAIVRAIENWRDNRGQRRGTGDFPPLDLLRVWSREHGEPLPYVVDLATRLTTCSPAPAPPEEEEREADLKKKEVQQTPRAKKEERERKVRTLMSMR